MLPRVFVYGTLMPGRLRWELLAPFATGEVATTVPGVLYDTGRGWPAASFEQHGSGDARVPGWLVEVLPDAAAAVLAVLDEVEGVDAEPDGPEGPAAAFRRVTVRPACGGEAWAYEATVIGADWVRIDAWTNDAER